MSYSPSAMTGRATGVRRDTTDPILHDYTSNISIEQLISDTLFVPTRAPTTPTPITFNFPNESEMACLPLARRHFPVHRLVWCSRFQTRT